MPDVVIQVSRTCKIQQIEDFPKKCKRSRPGAMHLRPGATLVVTRDELKHLKAKHERAFMVVGETKDPPAEETKPAPDGPKPDGDGKGDSKGGDGDKPDVPETQAAKPAKGKGSAKK